MTTGLVVMVFFICTIKKVKVGAKIPKKKKLDIYMV